MLNPFRSERGISVPGGILAVAAVGTIFAGSYLCSQGLIRVSVSEKHPGGDHIRLAVPGALVPLAMAFVPASEIGRHLPAEARRHLPVAQAAMDELQKLPDCTLVTVDGPEEHVRIQVKGGKLVIDVNDHADEVHVTLPMSSLRSVMAKLERAAEYSSGEGENSGATSHTWKHEWRHRSCSHDKDHGVTRDDDDDSAEPAEGSAETL